MALLSVGGVMTLWNAGLMIRVLLETILPGGAYLSPLVGFAAALTGLFIMGG
jgi:predicted metal-binding membrane protein